jgi:hypothetical protein
VITRYEVLVEGHGQQSPFGPNTWLAQACSGLPSHKLGWRYIVFCPVIEYFRARLHLLNLAKGVAKI